MKNNFGISGSFFEAERFMQLHVAFKSSKKRLFQKLSKCSNGVMMCQSDTIAKCIIVYIKYTQNIRPKFDLDRNIVYGVLRPSIFLAVIVIS